MPDEIFQRIRRFEIKKMEIRVADDAGEIVP
jgi:hypothetical protein